MVDKHIKDNLFIDGYPSQDVAQISCPPGKKLTIEGVLNVVDKPGSSDGAAIQIEGIDIADYNGNTLVVSDNGSVTLTADTDILYINNSDSSLFAGSITLPRISAVHPKSYRIVFGRNVNDIAYCQLRANGDGESVDENSDVFDGHATTTDGGTWYSFEKITSPGSFVISTSLGTADPFFGTSSENEWLVSASHNVKRRTGIYLDPVQVASTSNIPNLLVTGGSFVGDLIDGYILEGYDRVLLKNQTNQTENGVYIVVPIDGLQRVSDVPFGSLAYTHLVHTNTGNLNANNTYRMFATVPNSMVGINALTYVNQAPNGSSGNIQFADSTGYGFSSNTALSFDGTSLIVPPIVTASPSTTSTVFGNLTSGSINMGNSMTSGHVVIGSGQTTGGLYLGGLSANVTSEVMIRSKLTISNKGAIGQSGSDISPVTINSPSGKITTVSLTLTSHSKAQFQVNNTYTQGTSIVLANIIAYAGDGSVSCMVHNIGANSFQIILTNTSGVTLTAACLIGFLII